MEQRQLTLCYVDDDPDDLTTFEEATMRLVKDVTLFRLSADFLTSMQSPPMPSIVFLDLNMPHFTGYQIIEFMRKNTTYLKMPIVVLSTANDLRSVETCWQLGADFYVVKSGTFLEFTASLEHVINIDWSTFKRDRDNFVYRFRGNEATK